MIAVNMPALVDLRESKGVKQVDMASALGMSQGNYSLIENGRVALKLEYLPAIALRLGMSIADLTEVLFAPIDVPKEYVV